MVWWSFVIILVEADWLETVQVDVEAELLPECQKAIDVGWSLESFLEGTCFLSSVDDLPSVIPCSYKVVKFNGRGVL